jgi:tRNA threonylcarbamoyl adenosine modification protein (Sua5/YciO/YrdC/YwlC family)
VPIARSERLDAIVELLLRGEVAAIPTDTVYGLAARPDDEAAVRRLAEFKGRDPQQPIAVLFDDTAVVAVLIEPPPEFERLARFWPGALTLIVPAHVASFASALVPNRSIGVRQPDDELARTLIRACGGLLAVTSANKHGQPPATSAEEITAIFGDDLVVLDDGPRGGTASTVVDLTVQPPKVLREGPLTAAQLGLPVPS